MSDLAAGMIAPVESQQEYASVLVECQQGRTVRPGWPGHYLREESRSKVWTNGCAGAGTFTLPLMMSLLLISRPYKARFASPSWVTAAPVRSRPPKIPRERE